MLKRAALQGLIAPEAPKKAEAAETAK